MLFRRNFISKHLSTGLLKKQSVKALFMTAVLASSFFISLYPQQASATTVGQMSLLDQAKSYLAINTLGECIRASGYPDGSLLQHNQISSDNASSGKWFSGSGLLTDNWEYGYLAGGGLGDLKDRADCNSLVMSATTLWGYSSPLEMLCSFWHRIGGTNGGTCMVSPENKAFDMSDKPTVADSFMTAIKQRVYGGNDPQLTDAMKYVIYSATFFADAGCTAKPVVNGKLPSGEPAVEGNGISIYTVRTVTSTMPQVTKYFYTSNNQEFTPGSGGLSGLPSYTYYTKSVDGPGPPVISLTSSDYFGITGNNQRLVYHKYPGNDEKPSCRDIASTIDSTANSAGQYFVSHPSELASAIHQSNTTDVCTVNPGSSTCPPTTAVSTCTVQGIGWIICPVVNLMAGIADSSFNFLSNNFLKTNTAIFDTNSPTYGAWTTMRSFANIAFVIVFLIIIFSQMTSVGITNYGVKKMLPRLVIAAILVNVSYFICQLSVDISNILGYSLKDTLAGMVPVSASIPTGPGSTGTGWQSVAVGVLAIAGGTALGYALLSTLIPLLLAAVVALIMILFILIARQALILILIVVSPLAFVAFLLPNTEKWYKMWQKTLVAMLMLFPIIAFVFGISTLASVILANTYTTDGDTNNLFGQLIAAGILVLPLFVVPGLLKKSLDGVGGLGAKINGIGNKLGGALGRKGSQGYENSRIGQFKKYRGESSALKRAQIQSGTYRGRGGKANPANWASTANRKVNNAGWSGKFGDRASTKGAVLADAEDAELLKNATSKLDNSTINGVGGPPLSQDQMMQIATGADVTDSAGTVLQRASSFDTHTRKAAIQKAAKIATVGQAERLNDASVHMTASERKIAAQSIASSSVLAKAPWLGGKNLGDIEQGVANTDVSALRAITDGKITAETLANTDASGVARLLRVATPGTAERTQLQSAHAEYLRQPLLHAKVTPGSDHDINLGLI